MKLQFIKFKIKI